MSESPITYRGVVYPWHCDHVGHMNVMWYTSKFDEATWCLFAGLGLTGAYFRDRGRGMAAVEAKISYLKELLPGDVVFVRSGIVEVRDKAIRFTHEMVNQETQAVAARVEYTSVHVDRAIRRACPFPDEVVQRARALVSAAPAT